MASALEAIVAADEMDMRRKSEDVRKEGFEIFDRRGHWDNIVQMNIVYHRVSEVLRKL